MSGKSLDTEPSGTVHNGGLNRAIAKLDVEKVKDLLMKKGVDPNGDKCEHASDVYSSRSTQESLAFLLQIADKCNTDKILELIYLLGESDAFDVELPLQRAVGGISHWGQDRLCPDIVIWMIYMITEHKCTKLIDVAKFLMEKAVEKNANYWASKVSVNKGVRPCENDPRKTKVVLDWKLLEYTSVHMPGCGGSSVFSYENFDHLADTNGPIAKDRIRDFSNAVKSSCRKRKRESSLDK